jgi:hypothetical protein
MKKALTVLAILAVFAAPALAQSFDPDNGTGNVLSYAPAPTALQNEKVAAARNGLHSFAMAPRSVASNPNRPSRHNHS